MKNRVSRIDDLVVIRNVLISVSDKKGLDRFIPALVRINPDITFFSTGGTHGVLADILGAGAKKHLVSVSDYTGQPEMQGGLVKTLDFKIYLGLLSETYNKAHQEDLARTGAVSFDMVVVNLYPFGETVAQADTSLEDARANIDIGGPSMLRASAKNYLRLASVCDPRDYPGITEKMETLHGALSFQDRFTLAQKAFAHTAAYDQAIAAYLPTLTTEAASSVYTFSGGTKE